MEPQSVKQTQVTDMVNLPDFSRYGDVVREAPTVAADPTNPETFGGLPKQGDTGDTVFKVQQALADRNISSVGEVDGAFGNKTSLGIQEFQGQVGLPRTGVLDQATYTQLVETPPSFDEEGKVQVTPIEKPDFSAFGEVVTADQGAAPQEASPVVEASTDNASSSSFFLDIGVHAESDHGGVPEVTNDAREANLPVSQRTRDIGFGHKITAAENASGFIHGVRFINEDGTFRELTEEDKTTILMADMDYHADRARVSGWDTKLANIGSSWDQLGEPYRNALTSLAYNVGGDKAGRTWTNVLTAARDQNVQSFALGLRRKDAGRHTAGMDNRVAKELYYSGLISSLSEVSDQLPLANAAQAGIPE